VLFGPKYTPDFHPGQGLWQEREGAGGGAPGLTGGCTLLQLRLWLCSLFSFALFSLFHLQFHPSSSSVMSGKASAPAKAAKVAAPKKASAAVPESQLKKRKTVDALKAKQAAAKVIRIQTQMAQIQLQQGICTAMRGSDVCCVL
jgi:hypothetical protein